MANLSIVIRKKRKVTVLPLVLTCEWFRFHFYSFRLPFAVPHNSDRAGKHSAKINAMLLFSCQVLSPYRTRYNARFLFTRSSLRLDPNTDKNRFGSRARWTILPCRPPLPPEWSLSNQLYAGAREGNKSVNTFQRSRLKANNYCQSQTRKTFFHD